MGFMVSVEKLLVSSMARKDLPPVFAHSSLGVSKTEKGDVKLEERKSMMERILLPPSCT